MEAAVWTARGAVTQWPRAPRRRSFPALAAADRPRGLAAAWRHLTAAVAHWWTKDLNEEGRDLTLIGALMGLVAMGMVAATVWAQTTAIAQPYERQLERQHAEWVRSQSEAPNAVQDDITSP